MSGSSGGDESTPVFSRGSHSDAYELAMLLVSRYPTRVGRDVDLLVGCPEATEERLE